MIPIYNPPDMKVGDTYKALAFQFTDTSSGTPLDFEDGTNALAQIRFKSGTLAYSWSANSSTAVVAGNAIQLLAIPATITRTFSAGCYTFEMQITDPEGVVITELTGLINLVQDNAYPVSP